MLHYLLTLLAVVSNNIQDIDLSIEYIIKDLSDSFYIPFEYSQFKGDQLQFIQYILYTLYPYSLADYLLNSRSNLSDMNSLLNTIQNEIQSTFAIQEMNTVLLDQLKEVYSFIQTKLNSSSLMKKYNELKSSLLSLDRSLSPYQNSSISYYTGSYDKTFSLTISQYISNMNSFLNLQDPLLSSLLNQLYYKLYLYNGPNEQELNQLFMENCASICSLSQSFKSMIHYLCYYIQYMTYHHIYINRNLLTVIPETSYYFESILVLQQRKDKSDYDLVISYMYIIPFDS